MTTKNNRNKTSRPKRLRNHESPHRPTGNEIAAARRNPPMPGFPFDAPGLVPRGLWPSKVLGTAHHGQCVGCKKHRLVTRGGRCVECALAT